MDKVESYDTHFNCIERNETFYGFCRIYSKDIAVFSANYII